MFGFFRKAKTDAPPPQPAPAIAAPPNPDELTIEQKKLISEEVERHSRGEGNNIDAALGLLHLTGDKIYLKGFLQFLGKSDVGLLIKDPKNTSDFLTLSRDNLVYLPIFTRPEHSQQTSAKFPAYRYCAMVKAKPFFTSLTPGMGLFINPGHTVFTYMMPPSMFTEYVGVLLQRK